MPAAEATPSLTADVLAEALVPVERVPLVPNGAAAVDAPEMMVLVVVAETEHDRLQA